jgi:hypothetical protein
MLLRGECYENVYTWGRTNNASFKMLKDVWILRSPLSINVFETLTTQ